jgi:hypothetical protein
MKYRVIDISNWTDTVEIVTKYNNGALLIRVRQVQGGSIRQEMGSL